MKDVDETPQFIAFLREKLDSGKYSEEQREYVQGWLIELEQHVKTC